MNGGWGLAQLWIQWMLWADVRVFEIWLKTLVWRNRQCTQQKEACYDKSGCEVCPPNPHQGAEGLQEWLLWKELGSFARGQYSASAHHHRWWKLHPSLWPNHTALRNRRPRMKYTCSKYNSNSQGVHNVGCILWLLRDYSPWVHTTDTDR